MTPPKDVLLGQKKTLKPQGETQGGYICDDIDNDRGMACNSGSIGGRYIVYLKYLVAMLIHNQLP